MHPSDLIAQATFLNADELQFRKARERKRRPKVVLPDIPDGPCCHRCEHWKPPGSHDDFGACRQLVIVSEKVTYGPERGTVFRVDAAMAQGEWPWDYLATRGFCEGCSLFDAKDGREAA